QSWTGEIEGLEHESGGVDYRDRGYRNDERDPPGTENFEKSTWIDSRCMASKDAPGQPREWQIKRKDQGQGSPEHPQALATEPAADAVDPFAEDRFYGGRVAWRFVPDVDPERGVCNTRRPREQ